MSDHEGRWQAFVDYSSTYKRCFSNPKKRFELGIPEGKIGEIEGAAFNIIRLRTVPDMPKVHMIMRELPKYCGTKEGLREVAKIAEVVSPVLPSAECVDAYGTPFSCQEIDEKWIAKHRQDIIYHIKRARDSFERKKEKETPISLLKAALAKLKRDEMNLDSIKLTDCRTARTLLSDISRRIDDLNNELYKAEKNLKKLSSSQI